MSGSKRQKNRKPGTEQPQLRLKIHFGEDALGPGKMQLFALLHETGSISEAARQMGIGYRRAWLLLDTLQACFEEPLYTTGRGSGPEAGTRLTKAGQELLERYQAFHQAIEATAAPFLGWLQKHQSGGG